MFTQNPEINKKYTVNGIDYIFDGRGYVPAPVEEFQETDPLYSQEKELYAKLTDIPEVPDVRDFAIKAKNTRLLFRSEAVYVNDYVKITYLEANKVLDIKSLKVRTSNGDKWVDGKAVYNDNWAYLFHPLLSQSANWEYFEVKYDIVDRNSQSYAPDLQGRIGRNYMQDEEIDAPSYHGRVNVAIFKSIYSHFGGTERQALESRVVEGSNINQSKTDEMAVKHKFNILARPYGNAARAEEYDSTPDILTVGSHYGNYYHPNMSHGFTHPTEPNTGVRTDITASANTFLKNTVAVTCGMNIDGSGIWASYGFGVEFFEVLSQEYLSEQYPKKNVYWTICGVYTPDARTIRAGKEGGSWHILKPEEYYVGETLWLHYGSDKLEFTITEILTEGEQGILKVDRDLPVKYDANNNVKGYLWRYIDVAPLVDKNKPEQSPTCSIVSAKLAIVQDRTNANWQLVRKACRMTASNSTMQIFDGKKLYTPNWDAKRGFGMIDVDKAVEWIEDNYINNEDWKDTAVVNMPKINPLLKLKDLENENVVSAGMIRTLVNYINGGARNLISKQYLRDWNKVNPNIVTEGSDEDGDYLAVDQVLLRTHISSENLPDRDIFQRKIKYKPNTQYAFKIRWKLAGEQAAGLVLYFAYSDKSYGVVTLNKTTISENSIITPAGKSLVTINSGIGGQPHHSKIYEIQLIEGNSHPDGFLTAPEDMGLI